MKKVTLVAIGFLLIFSMYLPNSNAYAKQLFNDVPTHHIHYDDIMYLVDRNIITETSSKLGVNDIVTREEAAIMVIKAIGLDGTPRETKFSDIPANSKNSGYIQSAVEASIIYGTGANTFSPKAKVNRGQMAAFIDRAFELPQGTESFTDVPKTHYAYENIKKLVAANIAHGYGNGKFGPTDQLTRGQIAAFIVRAMKYVEGNGSNIGTTNDIKKLVDRQLNVVNNRKVPGYTLYQAYSVHLTGKDIPEVVVSSYGFEPGSDEYIDKSLLQVYQYNEVGKKWLVINSFKDSGKVYSYKPLQYLTKGKLIDDKTEQLVVGYSWGSDNAYTPIVYGSTDGKTVKTLLTFDDSEFLNGIPVIKDKELYFTNHLSIVGERYVFQNGEFVRFIGTGADDYRLAGLADHILYLVNKNGSPAIIGDNSITMKVGESFSIIRNDVNDDSQDYIFRMYFNSLANGPLVVSDGVLQAVKKGRFTLGVILNDYYSTRIDVEIVVE